MTRNCHTNIPQINPRHPEEARIGSGIVTNTYNRSTLGIKRKQEFGQELSQTHTTGQPPAPRESKNWVRNCHKYIQQVNPRHPEEARIWSGIVTNIYSRSTPGTQRKQEFGQELSQTHTAGQPLGTRSQQTFGQELSQTHTAGQPPAPRGSKNLVRNCHKHMQQVNPRHPEEARIGSGIVTNIYSRSTPGTQRKQELGQELSQTHTPGQPSAPGVSKHLVRNCHKHIPQVNPRHPEEARIWSGIVTNTYCRSTLGTRRKQTFGQELSQTHTPGQPPAPGGSKHLVRNCHKHILQINPRHPEEANIWSGIVTNTYCRSTLGIRRKQTFGQELSQTHTAGQPPAPRGSKHLVRNGHKHIQQINLSASGGSKHLVRNCHKHILQINPRHPEEANIWSGIVTNTYCRSTSRHPEEANIWSGIVTNTYRRSTSRHPEEANIWSGIVTNTYPRSTLGIRRKQTFGQELSQTHTADQPLGTRRKQTFGQELSQTHTAGQPSASGGSKHLVRNCHKHIPQVNPRHPEEANIWSGIVKNIYSRSTPGTQRKQEFGQELTQTYTTGQPSAPRKSKHLVRNCHKHIPQINPRHQEEARIWSGMVTNIYSRSTPGTQRKQEFGQELSQTHTTGHPSASRGSKNLVRNCHKHIPQVNPRHPEEARIWSGIVTNIYSRSTPGTQREQELGQGLSQTYTAGQPPAPRGSKKLVRNCHQYIQQVNPRHPEEARIWSGIVTNTYRRSTLGIQRKQEFGQELSQIYTAGQPPAPRESKNWVRNCHKHIQQVNPRHPEEARIWSGIVTNTYRRSTSRHPESANIWSGIVTNTYPRSTLGIRRKQTFGQELSQTHTADQPLGPRRKQTFGQELSQTHTAGQPSASGGSKHLVRNCHKHIPQVNPRHPEEANIWSGIVTNTYRRSTSRHPEEANIWSGIVKNIYSRSTPGTQRKQEFGQELTQTYTTGQPSAPRESKHLVRNCHKHIPQINPRHQEEARIWSGMVTNIYSRSTPGTQRKQEFGQELSQTHTTGHPSASRGSKNLVRNCHKHIPQVNPRHPEEARIWSGIVTNIYSRSTPRTQREQELGQGLSQTYTAGQPPAPRGSKNLVRNCHKYIQQVNPRHPEEARIWSGIVTNTYRRSTLSIQRKQEFGQELSQIYTAGQPPAPRGSKNLSGIVTNTYSRSTRAPRGSKNLVRNCHKHIPQINPRHQEEANIWSGIVTNTYRRSTPGTQRKQTFGQVLSQTHTAGQPPAPRGSKNLVRNCHKHIQQVNPRHPEEARIWSGIVTNTYSRSTPGTQRKQTFGQELSQTYTAGQPPAPRGSKHLVRNCHKHIPQVNLSAPGESKHLVRNCHKHIPQVNLSAPRGSKHLVRNCHKHIPQINPRHPEEARIWSGIVTNIYSRSTPGTQRKQTFGQELSQTHTADQPPAPRGSKNLVRNCHKHIQQVNPRHPEEARIWSGIVTNIYSRSTPGTQRKQTFGQELSQTYTAGQPPAPRGSKNLVRNCHKHIPQINPRHPEEARIWSGIVTNTYNRSTLGIQRKQEFGQESSQIYTAG